MSASLPPARGARGGRHGLAGAAGGGALQGEHGRLFRRGVAGRALSYLLLQAAVRLLFRLLAQLRVEGLERYPHQGPYLLVINHLHWLDLPAVFTTFQHFVAGLMKRKWERHLIAGPLMRHVGNAIPIETGRPDPRALARARRWLEAGGVLLVAPEGTRSRSGGLAEGLRGAAFLANRAGAPLVPVAMWGQERAFQQFVRLRRPPIHVSVGEPIHWDWSSERAPADELDACTALLMRRLAELLPEAYRGVHGDGG